MAATNSFPIQPNDAAGREAATLLSQRKVKSAPAKTSAGGSARRVAGTKASGRGVMRTRGGSV